jgi:hypothetical protein
MSGTRLRFIIQKHETHHPHYDLRLETQESLKSWILPKEPPIKEREKRLAIEDVREPLRPFDKACLERSRKAQGSGQARSNDEDRELDLINSRNIIEDGYGNGKAEIWDKGIYKLKEKDRSKIVFEAEGKKFLGRFILLLPSWGRWGKRPLWVLFKN